MNIKKLTTYVGSLIIGTSALLTGCTTTGTSATPTGTGTAKTTTATQSYPTYHFADSRPATGKKVFIFDPKQYAWATYDSNGQLVRDGIASGGRAYCSDINARCTTPSGTYSVYRKGGADCKSSIYPIGKGGAPMPYCMFFRGGYAVHGSYDVPPGMNASHGCIRVLPSDAQWLSQNFMSVGTTVIIRPY